jgi:hypothetical protein
MGIKHDYKEGCGNRIRRILHSLFVRLGEEGCDD